MMPSLKLTGGSLPSFSHLWTASRPVNTTPEISTMSPTLSARTFSSVKGAESWIIADSSIKPLLDLALGSDESALPPVRPAHIGHRHEEGGRQAVEQADLGPEERRLAVEAHGADSELVGLAGDLLLEERELLDLVLVSHLPQNLLF